MTEFITIAGAVFVGYILATVVLCALMLNKFVTKKITEYAFKMSMDLYEELEEKTMFK